MNNAICYSFSFIVEAIILWQYSSNLFITKHSTKKRILTLLGLYIALFIVSLFESQWLNAIFYFSINFIFLVTQYEMVWYTGLFHSAILIAIMGMCELIVYAITNRFTPNYLAHSSNLFNLIVITIFSKIMFFTITYILIHILKKKENHIQSQDKSVFLLMFIPLSSVLIMLTFITIGNITKFSSSINWMLTISAICLLITNLLVFGINQYNQRKNMEFTEMQLTLQKESDSVEYYEMLLSQTENQSILIHDIKKHLQSIETLNAQKPNEKISSYIKQLMQSSDLMEVAKLCDNDMLNTILSRYKRQFSNNHIAFHTDIRCNTINFINDADLTSLFCNLLDNAFESASVIPDSYIEINTSKKEKSPLTLIMVINSCRRNPFDKATGILTTTKQNPLKHGFGIKSIRKIVKKYQGNIKMYFDDDTMTFHTIITLKQPS